LFIVKENIGNGNQTAIPCFFFQIIWGVINANCIKHYNNIDTRDSNGFHQNGLKNFTAQKVC